MSERVQALLLDSSRCKYPVIALSEIHRPSVIAMFIWHQRRVAPLPELMDRKKRDIMERKGDKEDENKRQKQQKESSAAAL